MSSAAFDFAMVASRHASSTWSENVFPVGLDLQVIGVATRSIATQVVDDQFFGDWAYPDLVHQPVDTE